MFIEGRQQALNPADLCNSFINSFSCPFLIVGHDRYLKPVAHQFKHLSVN